MSIKIYKDVGAHSIFIEDANGAQFLNSLQASVSGGKIAITDLAKNFEIVSGVTHTEFVDYNDVQYPGNSTEVCNELNAIFQTAGTPTGNIPSITSPLEIQLTEGDSLNYELTADYGVGYEWDLSNVPGIVNVEGNVRKIIGGSYLTGGEYDIPVKAINYNGEDSKIIKLTVSSPSFPNTKSVQFDNSDWLGANAGILSPTLGRSANGSGLSDAWSISFWFKAGTSANANQTILYFGNQDTTNQGHIQIKYNGASDMRRIIMRYGSENNRLNFFTPMNSIVPGQWAHVLITYNGGTTGSASNSINSYYGRFKFFIDEVEVALVTSHNNYGYSGSIIGHNFRVGRFSNGQSLRNNCRLDELAIFNDDISSEISSLYNSGKAVDMMSLATKPEHWWRMGDGDSYPYLLDIGFQANCIFVMNNMTVVNIVNDVP